MKNINVKLTVTNGILPLEITVFITNLTTKKVVEFDSKKSFDKSFSLDSGKYAINVFGENPNDGKTEIIVTGDFKSGPFHSSKRTTIKTSITELFLGTI